LSTCSETSKRLFAGIGAAVAPAHLSVVVSKRHAAAIAPGAGQLVLLSAKVRDHDAAATAGAARLRFGGARGFLAHADTRA